MDHYLTLEVSISKALYSNLSVAQISAAIVKSGNHCGMPLDVVDDEPACCMESICLQTLSKRVGTI